MVVKTHCKGHAYTGVEVGAGNVRRYFPRESDVIELHLDHLLINAASVPISGRARRRLPIPAFAPGLNRRTSMAARARRPSLSP